MWCPATAVKFAVAHIHVRHTGNQDSLADNYSSRYLLINFDPSVHHIQRTESQPCSSVSLTVERHHGSVEEEEVALSHQTLERLVLDVVLLDGYS